MKKFFALVCMITCIFGLTACGSEKALTEYEQQKVDYAEQLAAQRVVPLLVNFMDDAAAGTFAENTNEEIEYIFSNDYSMNVDGYAVASAIESYHSAAQDMGSVKITTDGLTASEVAREIVRSLQWEEDHEA